LAAEPRAGAFTRIGGARAAPLRFAAAPPLDTAMTSA